MGFCVHDEVICTQSGYSLDMLVPAKAAAVHGHGADASSSRETSPADSQFVVEFDGPTHFLAHGAPSGPTLTKQRHLQLLGYELVTVPFHEWTEVDPLLCFPSFLP